MDPYQHPTTPGVPQPPQPYYPPPPQPYYPPPPPDPNRGIRTAGTIAIWMWILAALIPVALVVGCIGLCGFGAFLGVVSPSSSPSGG
jgi:hypothetical protein